MIFKFNDGMHWFYFPSSFLLILLFKNCFYDQVYNNKLSSLKNQG